ncbi:MAG: metallophosphoesterase [Bacteroidales bacterium]|nr:MAG: metallophosphoesterase [Bacteroidales bacterium]
MTRIGLLSDTHGHWDERLASFFEGCDEIWHAGDIGSLDVADAMARFKPFKAVHGNIDDNRLRVIYPKIQRFTCEGVDVFITHIGGVPSRYERAIIPIIETNPPKLFICGHSHILKVMFDKKRDFLYMNPGAAGVSGFHKYRTALRFSIDGSDIKDLEVLEIPRSS